MGGYCSWSRGEGVSFCINAHAIFPTTTPLGDMGKIRTVLIGFVGTPFHLCCEKKWSIRCRAVCRRKGVSPGLFGGRRSSRSLSLIKLSTQI